MSYNVVSTLRFEKELKRLSKKYSSLKAEFSTLVELLQNNPETGIQLGNNCFKIRIRIASKGKGKSGGARIITYLYRQAETVYLLSMYDKGEIDTIKTNELKEMIDCLDL